jgi:hypothetical protein
MTSISLDISGKVSSEHVRAISEIQKAADVLGIHFFVIGATARILESEAFGYQMASIRINFQRMLILPELKPTRSMAFLLKFTVWRKHWLTVSNFGIKSVWISFWNFSNSTGTEKKSILQG